MKKKLFIIFCLLFLPLSLYSQFMYEEEVDKITDEMTIYFSAFSEESGSLDENAVFYLITKKDKIVLVVDFRNEYTLKKKHALEYRFDKEQPAKINSKGIDSYSYIFTVTPKTNYRDFVNFLDELLISNKLVVRTTSSNKETLTATFNVSGLISEIKKSKIKGTLLEGYMNIYLNTSK